LKSTLPLDHNAAMNERQHLLDQARRYCDPETGEVVELIPEDLMRQLRVAKLAGALQRGESRTGTSATWFVFLNDNIRDQVLAAHREAKRKRRTRAKGASSGPTVARGLGGFVRRRKSDE
jgi:hypothetical protein